MVWLRAWQQLIKRARLPYSVLLDSSNISATLLVIKHLQQSQGSNLKANLCYINKSFQPNHKAHFQSRFELRPKWTHVYCTVWLAAIVEHRLGNTTPIRLQNKVTRTHINKLK